VETENIINSMARIIGHCERREPDESDWIQWLEINSALDIIASSEFKEKYTACNRMMIGFMAGEARRRTTGNANAEVHVFAATCAKCGNAPVTATVMQESPPTVLVKCPVCNSERTIVVTDIDLQEMRLGSSARKKGGRRGPQR